MLAPGCLSVSGNHELAFPRCRGVLRCSPNFSPTCTCPHAPKSAVWGAVLHYVRTGIIVHSSYQHPSTFKFPSHLFESFKF